MEKVVKPNWDIFKSKFSENPTGNFEWLCYLLFSKEHNRNFGIFRYKNHKASEAEIIEFNGKRIAFQAKFTDSISSHSKDLIKALEDLKTRNLDKLIIYSNSDFGQNNSNKENPSDMRPKSQKEIEKKAFDLNIEIDWRLGSRFESEFVCIENSTIASHFFSNDHSIISLISDIIEEKNIFLDNSKSPITFNNFEKEPNILKSSEKKTILISGISGVGKTTLVKNYFSSIKKESENNDFGLYILKPDRFDVKTISDVFSIKVDDFIDFHKDSNHKIIVIDSAEKLITIEDLTIFKLFYKKLSNSDWKFIFTVIDEKKHVLLDKLGIKDFNSIENITLSPFEKPQLDILAKQNDFLLPNDRKLLELLTIPFYLDLYLEDNYKNKDMNYISFKEHLWNEKIINNDPNRSIEFLKAVEKKSLCNSYYFDFNSSYAKDLVNKQVIIFDKKNSKYYFIHDIYEEWALEKIINKEISNPDNFFEIFSPSHLMKKVFSYWLLGQSPNDFKKIISKLLDKHIPSVWKSNILSSCLLSDHANDFFKDFDYLILDKENSLLNDLIFVAKNICIKEDKKLFELYFKDNEKYAHFKLFLNKPIPNAWEPLIEFIYNNQPDIDIENNIDSLLPFLDRWTKKNKRGTSTRYSGLITLEFYKKIINKDSNLLSSENENLIFLIINNSSYEIKKELSIFLKVIVEKKELNLYDDLVQFLLKSSDSFEISLNLSIEVLNIFKEYKSLYTINKKLHRNKDKDFYTEFFEYIPSSPITGNFYYMLICSFDTTLNYIIEFVNEYIEYYKINKTQNSLELYRFEIEEMPYEHYGNRDLWEMYRGNNPSLPTLLISMHMALEKTLLDWSFETEEKKFTFEKTLFHILKNSKSISLTSVIASCVFKYPDYTTNVAMTLLKEKNFYILDNSRQVADKSLHRDSLRYLNGKSSNEIYIEALKILDNFSHRKISFFDLIDYYQKNKSELQGKLNSIFDYHYENKYTDIAIFESAFYDSLYGLDKRNTGLRLDDQQIQELYHKQQKIIESNPFLKDFVEQQKVQQENENLYIYCLSLENKLNSYFNAHEDSLEDYFNNDFNKVLNELQLLNEYIEQSEYIKHSFEHLPFLLNIYLLNFVNKLNLEDKENCFIVIENRLLSFFLKNKVSYKGIKEVLTKLPFLLEKYPDKEKNILLIVFVSLLSDRCDHYSSSNIRNTFPNLWKEHEQFFIKQFLLYLHFAPKYYNYQNDAESKINDWIEDSNNLFAERPLFGFVDNPRNEETSPIPEERTLLNFVNGNLNEIKNFELTQLNDDVITKFEDLHIEVLIDLFLLIPKSFYSSTKNNILLDLSDKIFFSIKQENWMSQIDYSLKNKFYDKYSEILLVCDVEFYDSLVRQISRFITNITIISKILENLIYVEEELKTIKRFWKIWEDLRINIVDFIKSDYHSGEKDNLIQIFLFSVPHLKTDKNWPSFVGKQDKSFFKKIIDDLAMYPSTLNSIVRLLSGAGKIYLSDGIDWIHSLLKCKDFNEYKISINTCESICIYINTYIKAHNLKNDSISKDKVFYILDSLISCKCDKAWLLKNSLL